MSKIKKGVTFVVLMITIFITSISCSTKVITGKYRTNFNTYGMFSKTLTLDCEGNAIMNFSGDLQNNNSYGVWKMNKDTLILYFDTIVNEKNKFKGEIKFLVKRNKLSRIVKNDTLIRNIIKICKENNINYKKVLKSMNKTPKDWKGKMRNQYFKKIENTDCAK